MKYGICIVGVCVTAMCGVPEALAADQAAEKAAIERAIESYTAAFNARDAKALAEHWGPEAVFVNPLTGVQVEGRDAIVKGRNIDARAQFFYFATVNTPAMTWKLIGKGSQYAWGYLAANGDYLDGSKTYKLNLPKDPPANQFISVVLYDPQTRSELQTGQPFPSYNNQKHKDIFKSNEDGSVDLYFGPKAPAGKESNWLQTVPKKGWFCILRLYSPTEAWFDKTWRPGEIELSNDAS